jgi:cytochrome c oxidase assembly protein subunit 11
MSVASIATPASLANRRLLKKLLVITIAMFGFGFALVPLYEKVCQVTGIRNILKADHVAPKNTQVDYTRKVTVEFDSNTHKLGWSFKPLEGHVDVHPGALQQVVYEIRNNEDRVITGQAIPSYAPQAAGGYFKKVQCFCFEQQTLQPGEVRQMPIVFVIDPEMPKSIGAVALSFTFFEVSGRAKKVEGAT